MLAARLKIGLSTLLCLAIAACGGGGGGGSSVPPAPIPPPVIRPTAVEASRFLTQATFGPTSAEIDAVKLSTYTDWIAQQQGLATGAAALTHLDGRLATIKAANPSNTLNSTHFYEYFWREAATAPDQLRQRVKFALSEIAVISFADPAMDVRGLGSYYDMLGKNAFGNYRTLLEDVALHPMMGVYLTHIGNSKEDPTTGRTPDENFAREVMQLMSIGVFELNTDGTLKKDSSGNSIPTYTASDISNLAKVFTGFSWYSATPTNNTFRGSGRNDASYVTPMIPYAAFHSTSAKTFLGTTIPASTTADPAGDLKIALDTIFNHPNVGPFISKQLIQRLVTSNPSPAYVGRVSAVFNNNGAGVRGDLAAVVKAILTDSEARNVPAASDTTYGKIREPIVRLGNYLRIFGATSTSGNWLIGSTSASTSFAQSPMAAPSVFNFYRPGFSPPNTKMGNASLVAPEMQIVDEVTTAGYLNTLQTLVTNGIGTGSDVKASLASEVAVASDANALVDRLNLLLLYGSLSDARKQQFVTAINTVTIPSGGTTTQAQIDAALLNRAKLGVYLVMSSPDYLVQR